MIFVTCKDISYKYFIVAMAVSQLLVLFLFHSSLSVPNTADSTYIIFFVYWLELTCLHQDSIISMSYIIASIIVMLLPCLSCGRIYMSSSFPSQLLASFFSTPYTTTRPNASAAAAANSAADVVSLSLSSHIRASIIVMLLPCLSCG